MVDDDNVIDVIVSDVPFRSSLSLIHFPREGRDQGSILPTKCACSHSAARIDDIKFHQQKYFQLHWYALLEYTLNSYALFCTPVGLAQDYLRKSCPWNVNMLMYCF